MDCLSGSCLCLTKLTKGNACLGNPLQMPLLGERPIDDNLDDNTGNQREKKTDTSYGKSGLKASHNPQKTDWMEFLNCASQV